MIFILRLIFWMKITGNAGFIFREDKNQGTGGVIWAYFVA